jgi:hypothetical protein
VRAVAPCALIGIQNVYQVYLIIKSGNRKVRGQMEIGVNEVTCVNMSHQGVLLEGLDKIRNLSKRLAGIRNFKAGTY